MRIDIEYTPDTQDWGILYFVTPAIYLADSTYYMVRSVAQY